MLKDDSLRDSQYIKKKIIPSTQRTIVESAPSICSEKVCGKYLTYPKKENDTEGGLRTKKKYKKDTDEFPLVTYITVTYNRGDTLFGCMSSVWMQTYPNIEYIIIDGASTDNTLNLLLDNDDKIDYFISQKDYGIYNAMNKGVALAMGSLICFMNSDDVCVPQAAEHIVKEYKEHGADIICGKRLLFQNGIELDETTYLRPYIKKCVFRYIQMHHQATYSSRNAFESVGYFNEDYRLLSDWIWESSCIDKNLKVHFFDEILTKFNYDGASFIGIEKRDNEWIKWIMDIFPEINNTNAEYFLYALDRFRLPLCDFKGLIKRGNSYLANIEFRKCLYESMLFVCIDMCQDIQSIIYNDLNKENIMESLYKKTFKKSRIEHESIGELDDYLKCLLEYSVNDSFRIGKDEFNYLIKIKSVLNSIYYDLQVFLCFGKKRVLFLQRLKKLKLLSINRLFSNNRTISLLLFRKLRESWKV